MFTPEKIEEWILEAKERPASAPVIIQFVANRLRDLSEWNEKLREENLALRSGKRVEDYERQIAHLKYQLELLKRQFGGELPGAETLTATTATEDLEFLSLLIYGSQGRVLRLEVAPESLEDGLSRCYLRGTLVKEGEPPRLLVTPSSEELIFVFTWGRIASQPVASIPQASQGSHPDEILDWDQACIPEEPGAGETLACIVPVSKMALADFFVQTSRRGYMKKIRMALMPTIMENHYIGTGVKIPADQTIDLALSKKCDRFILVSWEGYMQCLDTGMLPYAIVEAMRLGKTDHLVAAFATGAGKSILVMTQIGKAIHRTDEGLESAKDLARKRQMLYSKARRDGGVRVVGAGAVNQEDWGVTLHQDGQITLHAMRELFGSGTISTQSELLAFTAFPAPGLSSNDS